MSALLGALLTLSTAAAPGAGSSGLRWHHDDWPAARAEAQAKGKLVAIDVWATWCHTCLSMKNYVLTEPELAAVADTHVWLALDYDLERNAAFFAAHPVSVFPTFLVVDPAADQVVARWAGSGSAAELARFFTHARAGDDPLSRGQRALAEDRRPEARGIFEAALAAGEPDPATRTRLLLGLVEVLYQDDKPACAARAAASLGQLDDTSQAADLTALAVYCALELPEGEERQATLRILAGHLAKLGADAAAPLAVDDRSAVLGTLAEAYEALGQRPDADRVMKQRLALLEAAAKGAKTAAARATFDYHRMEVYLHFGRHDDALRMLAASERAQPGDFNHPWRQAQVYLAKGDTRRGLEAIDRALARGYGGRKLRLYSTKLDLLAAAGRADEAKAVAKAGRAALAAMSEAQVRPGWRAEFEAKAARAEAAPR
jgi:thioredoxin-like negative regulator of GroEL